MGQLGVNMLPQVTLQQCPLASGKPDLSFKVFAYFSRMLL